jgi:hypothetical protein
MLIKHSGLPVRLPAPRVDDPVVDHTPRMPRQRDRGTGTTADRFGRDLRKPEHLLTVTKVATVWRAGREQGNQSFQQRLPLDSLLLELLE